MNLANVGLYLQVSCLLFLAHSNDASFRFTGEEFHDISLITRGLDDEIIKLEREIQDPYYEKPEKRGARAFMFGAQLAFSLLNVGTDVFFGVGGCCMVHKKKYENACGKIERITQLSKSLGKIGKKMDKMSLDSDMDMSYLDKVNQQNRMLLVEVRRLRSIEKDIIDTMSPELINEFKVKAAIIKKLANEGNTKIDKLLAEKITKVYEPLYATWNGRAQLFGTIGLNIMGELGAKAFERRVINKIKNDIDPEFRMRITLNKKANGAMKARKLLGGTDDLDKLARSMAKVKRNMNKGKLKQKKRVRAFSIGLSALGLGVEIFELYRKVQECVDRMALVDATETKLMKGLKNATGTLAQMENHHKAIYNQYMFIKTLLQKPTFLDHIKHFRHFIKEAAPAARRRMRRSATNLDIFLKYVDVSSPSLTVSTQEFLVQGLTKMEIKYECLLKRVEAITKIAADCKRGAGNLSSLYDINSKETKLINCVTKEGEPFTTFAQIKDFIIKDSTNRTHEENKYNPNCQLNSATLMENICRKKCVEGHAYEKLAAEYPPMKVADIKVICEPKGRCPGQKLTPTQKGAICNMKKTNKEDKVVTFFSFLGSFDPDDIRKVYRKCP